MCLKNQSEKKSLKSKRVTSKFKPMGTALMIANLDRLEQSQKMPFLLTIFILKAQAIVRKKLDIRIKVVDDDPTYYSDKLEEFNETDVICL